MNPALSYLNKMCEYALIAEVSTTPKPGLVDQHDSGAHADMCYDTFVASTNAIVPYLADMARIGYQWHDAQGNGLFAAIRPVGIQAEQAMFQATSGVNTHKGMIFSMGIIAAACGLYYRCHHCFESEQILLLAGILCRDTLEQDFQKINREQPKTHGEDLYARYGIKGIRGEAQEGFPSIRLCALPAIRNTQQTGMEKNQRYIHTLLTLMATVDDTNVLIRTSPELLAYEKNEARRILALGGASTKEGIEALRLANDAFIHFNISPGGCADLLAVTILLWKLEQYKEEDFNETIR